LNPSPAERPLPKNECENDIQKFNGRESIGKEERKRGVHRASRKIDFKGARRQSKKGRGGTKGDLTETIGRRQKGELTLVQRIKGKGSRKVCKGKRAYP